MYGILDMPHSPMDHSSLESKKNAVIRNFYPHDITLKKFGIFLKNTSYVY